MNRTEEISGRATCFHAKSQNKSSHGFSEGASHQESCHSERATPRVPFSICAWTHHFDPATGDGDGRAFKSLIATIAPKARMTPLYARERVGVSDRRAQDPVRPTDARDPNVHELGGRSSCRFRPVRAPGGWQDAVTLALAMFRKYKPGL